MHLVSMSSPARQPCCGDAKRRSLESTALGTLQDFSIAKRPLDAVTDGVIAALASTIGDRHAPVPMTVTQPANPSSFLVAAEDTLLRTTTGPGVSVTSRRICFIGSQPESRIAGVMNKSQMSFRELFCLCYPSPTRLFFLLTGQRLPSERSSIVGIAIPFRPQ